MTPPDNGSRRAKLAALQAAEQRRGRRRRLLVVLGSVVAVLAVVAAIVVPLTLRSSTSATPAPTATATSTSTSLSDVRQFTGLSAKHTTGTVNYPMSPPVGGDHDPVPQNCGVYSAPVRNENAVHSLEHGAVWITYAPNLPADQVAVLAADARGHDHVLVSPYTGLTSPVVLSAWGLQLTVDSATDPRVKTFIATYENGPQTPEPGAACSGGVGTPAA